VTERIGKPNQLEKEIEQGSSKSDTLVIMVGKIIVIGASAGGLSALRRLFEDLDPTLSATIFAVVHTSPSFPSYLATLLAKSSRLPVKFAAQGPFLPGVIYVAPPNHHVVVERHGITLSRGPRENRSRPAIDVTMRSAAISYGRAVIGVVLTGMLDDGTAGLFYVKRHGGITIAQDPQDAEFPSMPANAIEHVRIDYVLPLTQIGPTLNRLSYQELIGNASAAPYGSANGAEALMIEQDKESSKLTTYTCPECHGPISRIEDGSPIRFRCRVGHAFGLNSLAEAQSEYTEQVIWSALQALEAKAEIEENLRQDAQAAGDDAKVIALKKRIDDTRRGIALIAEVLHLSNAERDTTIKSPEET
jgi:two-component system chemotaxis response regulator CheB